MMKNLRIVLLGAVLVMAGCSGAEVTNNVVDSGGGGTRPADGERPLAGAGGSDLHPCDILLEDDVKALWPEKDFVVAEGSDEISVIGQRICMRESADVEDLTYVQLALIDPEHNESPVSVKDNFDAGKEFLEEEEIEEIEGIGTEAYHGGTGLKFGGGLHVYDAETDVSFNLSLADDDIDEVTEDDFERQRELAREIVARIREMQ